jgi:hypothetical protein
MVRTCWYRGLGAGAVVLFLATPACSPSSFDGSESAASDPNALAGEFVTYVADNRDGTSEWWHAVRTTDGREVRLDFDTPPLTPSGAQVRLHGAMTGERFHVSDIQ